MIQLEDFMGYKTLEKYHQLCGGKSRELDGVRELFTFMASSGISHQHQQSLQKKSETKRQTKTL